MKNVKIVLLLIGIILPYILCSCSSGSVATISMDSETAAEETAEIKEIDANVFNRDKIERICNLSSLRCEIHLSAEGVKENTILWIFHDDYSFIFEYDGYYEVGVSIGNIDTDTADKTVTVEMSAAKLLNCDIDENSLKKYRTVIYDKNNILQETAELSIEEATQSKGQAQERLRNYVIEKRPNFDVAESNAKKLIEDYVLAISNNTYKVVFKSI